MTYLEFKNKQDPLRNIKPMVEGTVQFKAEPWWFYFQLIISIVGVGYSLYALNLSLNDQNYFGLAFSLILMITILYTMAVKIIRVNITKTEIEFTYFFNRKKHIRFQDVSEIELKLQRGQICVLKSSKGKFVFQMVSIKNAVQLVKTFVHRSPIKFQKASNTTAIYYRN